MHKKALSPGEKLSGDKEAADLFVPRLRKLVEEKSLSLNQIFNCDETGLNYRLLPESTLASSFEKSTDQSLQPFTYLFSTLVITICVFFVHFPYLRNFIVYNSH